MGDIALKLYLSPGTSSMATHVALHEVGAPFETKVISLVRRENRSQEYLTLNPEGKVPTLVIDGQPLTEVAASLWYLAKQFPKAELLPQQDLVAEAEVISWMSFLASTIHPARQIGLQRWKEVFAVAERRLGGREWVVGRYSIADIHFFRLYWRFHRAVKTERHDYPSLTAHYEQMMARPAVKRTCEIEAAIGYEY